MSSVENSCEKVTGMLTAAYRGRPINGAEVRQMKFRNFAAEVWNNVDPQRLTPMQQHIWIRAAAETIAPGQEVQVVTVGSPGHPVALAPFSKTPSGPRRLKLLGAEEIEPVEVICRDAAAFDPLAQAIAGTGLPVSFGHYPLDTPFIEALRRAYRGRGIVVTRRLPVQGFPHIVLDDSWIEPERHLSSGRRSDLRRMQRVAAKLGKVTFSILRPSPENLKPLFDEALAVEESNWKGRSGTSVTQDNLLKRFFQQYAELACAAGILRLCFMRIDDKPVAMQLAAETNDRFWLFKIGYDEEFRRCSPGNLLMRETISYAARRKLKSYEFLGKASPWTEVWTQDARPIAAVRTYPFTSAGVAAALSDFAGISVKRLKHRWFHKHPASGHGE